MDVYIGIDVACAKHKYLPLVICHHKDERLLPLPLSNHQIKPPRGLGNALTLQDSVNETFANDVVNYLETVCTAFHLNPVCIGIDSPLKPRNNNLTRRAAEQALNKASISCYTTPSTNDFEAIKSKGIAHLKANKPIQNLPHSHQIFMLLGFALNKRLSKIAHCIEVYPHATMKRLGAADIHKSKGNQAELQLSVMSHYTGWPKTTVDWELAQKMCLGPMHDKVDAYSAAWVASLPEHKRICFGEAYSGEAIWVPKIDSLSISHKPRLSAPVSIKSQRQTQPQQVKPNSEQNQRLCPACKKHMFKRWPFGWDAHAAHRCLGLDTIEPEERKREFKARFMAE